MTTSVISNTDKTPGAYVQYLFGTGPNGAGTAPYVLLLVGLMTSDGAATPEAQLVNITDDATTAAAFGVKSQLRRMAQNVYGRGIQCKAIAMANPTGGVAASLTITISGTPTAAGTYNLYLAGNPNPIAVNTQTTDTLTTFATALVAAINAVDGLPFTATNVAGVVTITCSQIGTHGNWYIAFQDKSLLAAGFTVAITGTPINGGGYRFAGGTGVESAANVIAFLNGADFARYAIGSVDAVNLGLWRTYIDAQQAPIAANPGHLTAASSDTSTVVSGLAMTTLNDARFAMCFLPNSETHPGELAASIAADRTLQEQNDPCYNFDNEVVLGAAPQRSLLDQLQHAQVQLLLNSGVTPLETTTDGYVIIARAIVTRCLNGALPDYRCLDWSQAVVPDVVGDGMVDEWTNTFRPSNPRIENDPPDPSIPVPSGIGTPSAWNRDAISVLRAFERGDGYPGPLIINVDENLPVTSWNPTAQCIGTTLDVIVAPLNHRIDLLLRQRSNF